MPRATVTKADLERELHVARERLRLMTAEKEAREQDLTEFKNKVRKRVQEAMGKHDLCTEGVNEFLSDLDIEGVNRKYRVPITIVLKVEIDVEGQEDGLAAVDYLRDSMTISVDPEEFTTEIFQEIDDFNCPYAGVPYVGLANTDKPVKLGPEGRMLQTNEFQVDFGVAVKLEDS